MKIQLVGDNSSLVESQLPVTAEGLVALTALAAGQSGGGGGSPAAHAASHASGGNDPVTVAVAQVTGLQTALDGKAATAHTHAIADVTGLQAALDAKQATSAKGQANGYAGLGADGKVPAAQLPASSDPWTIIALAADFTTSLATAQDVPGLAFTPAANTRYQVEAFLLLRTATATVNPRAGLAWPTGLTDGGAIVEEGQAATGTPLAASGNPNAALLIPVGGVPNTTQSWPARLQAVVIAGASPSGNLRVQLASETAGTVVRIQAGSYLRYRTY